MLRAAGLGQRIVVLAVGCQRDLGRDFPAPAVARRGIADATVQRPDEVFPIQTGGSRTGGFVADEKRLLGFRGD